MGTHEMIAEQLEQPRFAPLDSEQLWSVTNAPAILHCVSSHSLDADVLWAALDSGGSLADAESGSEGVAAPTDPEAQQRRARLHSAISPVGACGLRGAMDFSVALENSHYLERHVERLEDPNLILAAKSATSHLQLRRQRSFESQIEELNSFVQAEPELMIRLDRRSAPGDAAQDTKVALLQGFFLDGSQGSLNAHDNNFNTGLILADKHGQCGALPENYYQTGAYMKLPAQG